MAFFYNLVITYGQRINFIDQMDSMSRPSSRG